MYTVKGSSLHRWITLPLTTALLLSACADDPSEQITPIGPQTLMVGPAGGTFDLGSGVTIRLPAGAVAQEVELGLDVADALAGVTDEYRTGSIYTIQPSGLELAIPAEVTIPNSGSGDGLLLVTLGGSGQIEALQRSVASGGTARGASRRLGPLWVTQRGDVVETLDLRIGSHELQAGDEVSIDLMATNIAGGLLDVAGASVESDDSEVAEVDVSGPRAVVRALKQGEATITATLQGVVASIDVTVAAGDIATLQLLPADLDLARRDTAQLTVRAFDATGNEQDVPDHLRWSSSDRSVARVDSRGQVTTYNSGEARIVATGGGALGEMVVRVAAPVPTALEIWPDWPVVGLDQTRQLIARTIDEFGDVIEEGAPAVTWSSSDESIATIDADGNVTGVALGQAEITAQSAAESVGSATVTLTVGVGRPESLALVAEPETFVSGQPLPVAPVVQLTDAYGNAVLTQGVQVNAGLASGNANLSGTKEADTDAQGRATFDNLIVNGSGPITLVFRLSRPAGFGTAQTRTIEQLMPLTLEFDVSSGPRVILPLGLAPEATSVSVDWGDGTVESFAAAVPVTHTYASGAANRATVTVVGSVTSFGAYDWSGASSLLEVKAWGSSPLRSLSYAFYNASALTSVPDELPGTVTDLSYAFTNAGAFNQDISGWDVSSVTDLSYAFSNADAFNQDISGWDVSSVTDMRRLFYNAELFNQNIGGWDVSNVEDFHETFEDTPAFNQNLSSWDLSSATDIEDMFTDAQAFNNGCSAKEFTCPLTWGTTTANVINMEGVFDGADSFNQSISDWDLSSVKYLDEMFQNNDVFNNGCAPNTYTCPLTWGETTSNVVTLEEMFEDTDAFNQDISNWNVSSVTDMEEMFQDAAAFNNGCAAGAYDCPLDWGQNTSEVTTMEEMFQDADAFNQNVGSWNVSSVTDMEEMFEHDLDYGDYVGTFNNGCAVGDDSCPIIWTDTGDLQGNSTTGNVLRMDDMFDEMPFDQPIGHWNTSSVTRMDDMFLNSLFNQDLTDWDVSSVTYMSEMFEGTPFNNGCAAGVTTCPLNNWDVSSVTIMAEMFKDAAQFNQDIGSWDVSSVTDMDDMFYDSSAFNQDLSSWCVPDLTSGAVSGFDYLATAWDGDPPGTNDDAGRAPGSDWGRPVWGTCPTQN